MKKIGFFISTLRGAGAEKSLSILANYLVENNYDVHIALHTNSSEKPFYYIDPKVKLHFLGEVCKIDEGGFVKTLHFLSSICKMRKTMREINPDCIISFMETVNIRVLIASVGLNFPVIVSEHNDPKFYRIGRIVDFLRFITYPMAKRVTVLGTHIKTYFPQRLQNKISVIGNAIDDIYQEDRHQILSGKIIKLLCIGRLINIKRMDLVIEAFSILLQKYDSLELTILGEGNMRTQLEGLAKMLRVADKVRMPGLVKDVKPFLAQADIFISASDTEGFSNAISEAMSAGLPVIATNCGGAIDDMITNGENGIIVPKNNAGAIADKLSWLIKNPDSARKMGENARKISQKFSRERICEAWRGLIEEILIN